MTLQRFVEAQDDVYEQALAELKAGAKRSHWMWFIFPQIAGLGHSTMAQRYGIADIAEARAYLSHPLLGSRLRACTQAVLDISGKSAHQILGSPDDVKFRSSMTLFDQVAPNDVFRVALDRYFDGKDDPLTISKLA